MILLSHLRSGSSWFLSGFEKQSFTNEEIFSTDLYNKPTRKEYLYRSVSMSARLAMVRISPNKIFKIHFSDIDRTQNLLDKSMLIEALKKEERTYLLFRRDIKKSIVSFAIAYNNNWNFHGDNRLLTKKFSLTQKDIGSYYDLIYGSMFRLRDHFKFKEQLVYEDLVSGSQQPATLDWNPNRSKLVERCSICYTHLIDNWPDVEVWINRLPKDL